MNADKRGFLIGKALFSKSAFICVYQRPKCLAAVYLL